MENEDVSKIVSDLYRKAREADAKQDFKLASEYYTEILKYRSDWIAEEYIKNHKSNMQSISPNDMSSHNNSSPAHKNKGKKYLLIFLLITIVIASFVVAIIYINNKNNNNPVYLLNSIYLENDYEKIKRIETCLENNNMTVEDLAINYADLYSKEQLFAKFEKISDIAKDYRAAWDFNQEMFEAIKIVFSGCFTDCSELQEGCEGYYTENPDAEPQESYQSKTITGKFNNENDGNSIYYSSRSGTEGTFVTYYGDFAVKEERHFYYDKGRYEWVNGKFYDEPASFKSKSEYSTYYKGEKISNDDVLNYCYIFEINGNSYLICLNNDYYSGFEDYFSIKVLNQ